MQNLRRRYPRGHIGRTRFDAAELLSNAFGLQIAPEDIDLTTGHWRKEDVYRWEVKVTARAGLDQWYGSWMTLTRFVKEAKKFGVIIDNELHEVWPNEPDQKPCVQ